MKALKALDDLGKTLDEQKFGYNAKIIRELREAGMTGEKSFALWLDCKKDVDFDQQGKTMTEFSEWKRSQTKDPNRDRDAELQMQVQWLTIVLMDANARTDSGRAEAVAAAVAFLDLLVERAQKADGHFGGAANQNVMGSVFARHYKLETTVQRRDGGAYVPGDVDAIYDKMILPHYRDSKQAVNLMNAWKKRIEQQTLIASSPRFKEAKEKFEEEKLPELKWGQALELFRLGQEEPAAATMISLIKANMGHRNASQWINELKGLLDKDKSTRTTPPPGDVPPPDAPPVSPEPPPASPGAPAPKAGTPPPR